MHSNFVWYELMTTDAKAAEGLHAAVVGWTAKMPAAEHVLHFVVRRRCPGAGMMTMPPEVCEAGWKPGWVGHIGVSDVDAYTKRVSQAGGKVHQPTDIPGIGRFSVIADPQGASYMMFRVRAMPKPAAPMTPGHVGWHEPHASDWAKAFDFYSGLYGWKKRDAMDMGPMGVYRSLPPGTPEKHGDRRHDERRAPRPTGSIISAFHRSRRRWAASRTMAARSCMVLSRPGGMWIINGQTRRAPRSRWSGPKVRSPFASTILDAASNVDERSAIPV
jgi:predicted enzyme related to lactoylglutathione lyase